MTTEQFENAAKKLAGKIQEEIQNILMEKNLADKKNIIYIVLAIIAVLLLTHPLVLNVIGALVIIACLYYISHVIKDIIDIAKEEKDNAEVD